MAVTCETRDKKSRRSRRSVGAERTRWASGLHNWEKKSVLKKRYSADQNGLAHDGNCLRAVYPSPEKENRDEEENYDTKKEYVKKSIKFFKEQGEGVSDVAAALHNKGIIEKVPTKQ